MKTVLTLGFVLMSLLGTAQGVAVRSANGQATNLTASGGGSLSGFWNVYCPQGGNAQAMFTWYGADPTRPLCSIVDAVAYGRFHGYGYNSPPPYNVGNYPFDVVRLAGSGFDYDGVTPIPLGDSTIVNMFGKVLQRSPGVWSDYICFQFSDPGDSFPEDSTQGTIISPYGGMYIGGGFTGDHNPDAGEVEPLARLQLRNTGGNRPDMIWEHLGSVFTGLTNGAESFDGIGTWWGTHTVNGTVIREPFLLGTGLTATVQFTFNSTRTNTLYFTNGLLERITQP